MADAADETDWHDKLLQKQSILTASVPATPSNMDRLLVRDDNATMDATATSAGHLFLQDASMNMDSSVGNGNQDGLILGQMEDVSVIHTPTNESADGVDVVSSNSLHSTATAKHQPHSYVDPQQQTINDLQQIIEELEGRETAAQMQLAERQQQLADSERLRQEADARARKNYDQLASRYDACQQDLRTCKESSTQLEQELESVKLDAAEKHRQMEQLKRELESVRTQRQNALTMEQSFETAVSEISCDSSDDGLSPDGIRHKSLISSIQHLSASASASIGKKIHEFGDQEQRRRNLSTSVGVLMSPKANNASREHQLGLIKSTLSKSSELLIQLRKNLSARHPRSSTPTLPAAQADGSEPLFSGSSAIGQAEVGAQSFEIDSSAVLPSDTNTDLLVNIGRIVDELAATTEQSEQAIDLYEQMLSERDEDLLVAQQQLASIRQQNDDLGRQVEVLQSKLKTTEMSLSASVITAAEMDQKNVKLEQKLKDALDVRGDLEEYKTELKSTSNRLKTTTLLPNFNIVASPPKPQVEYSSERNDIQHLLRRAEDELNEQLRQNSALAGQLYDAESKQAQSEQFLEKARCVVVEKDAAIDTLNLTVDRLKADNNKLADRLRIVTSEVESARSTVAALKLSESTLKQVNQRLDREAADLRAQIARSVDEFNKLQLDFDKMQSLTEARFEHSREIAMSTQQAKSINDNAVKQRMETTERYAKELLVEQMRLELAAQKDEFDSAVKELSDRIGEYEERLQAREKMIGSLTEQLEKFKNNASVKDSHLKAGRAEIARVKRELEDAQTQLCAAKEDVGSVEQRLAEKESELATMLDNLDEAKSRISSQSVQLGRIRDELQFSNVERQRLQTAHADLSTQLQQSLDHVKELQELLDDAQHHATTNSDQEITFLKIQLDKSRSEQSELTAKITQLERDLASSRNSLNVYKTGLSQFANVKRSSLINSPMKSKRKTEDLTVITSAQDSSLESIHKLDQIQLEDFKAHIASLQEDNDHLKAELASVRSVEEDLKMRHAELVAKHGSELTKSQAEAESLHTDFNQLTESFNILKQTEQRLELQVQQLQTQVAAKNREIETSQSTAYSADLRVKQTQAELASLQASLGEKETIFEAHRHDLTTKLQLQQQELEELQAEKAQQTIRLESVEAELNATAGLLSEEKKMRAELEANLSALTQSAEKLVSDHAAELKRLSEEHLAQLSTATEEQLSGTEKISQLLAENSQLQHQLVEAEANLKKVSIEMDKLIEDTIEKQKLAATEHQAALDEATRKLELAEASSMEQLQKLDSLNASKLNAAEEKISRLESDYTKLQDIHQRAIDDLNLAKAECESLQIQLDASVNSAEGTKAELAGSRRQMDMLSDELQESKTRAEQLTEDLETLKAKLVSMQDDFDKQVKDNNTRHGAELDSLANERDKLKDELATQELVFIEKHTAQGRDLKSQLDGAEAKLASTIANYEARILKLDQQFNATAANYAAQLEQSRSREGAADGVIKTLREEIISMEAKSAQNRDEIAAVRQKLDESVAQLHAITHAANEKNGELTEKLAQLQGELKKQTDIAAQAEHRNRALVIEVQQKCTEISRLQSQAASTEDKVVHLEAHEDELRAQVLSLESTITEGVMFRDALKQELATAIQARDLAVNESAAAVRHLRRLYFVATDDGRDGLAGTIDALDKIISAKEHALQDAALQIKEINATVSAQQQSIQELNATVIGLEKIIEDKKRLIISLEKSKRGYKAALHENETALQGKLSEMDACRSEMTSLRLLLASTPTVTPQITEQIERLQASVATLQANNEQLTKTAVDTDDRLQETARALAAVESARDSLQSNNAALATQHQAALVELDDIKNKLQLKEGEAVILRVQFTEMREKTATLTDENAALKDCTEQLEARSNAAVENLKEELAQITRQYEHYESVEQSLRHVNEELRDALASSEKKQSHLNDKLGRLESRNQQLLAELESTAARQRHLETALEQKAEVIADLEMQQAYERRKIAATPIDSDRLARLQEQYLQSEKMRLRLEKLMAKLQADKAANQREAASMKSQLAAAQKECQFLQAKASETDDEARFILKQLGDAATVLKAENQSFFESSMSRPQPNADQAPTSDAAPLVNKHRRIESDVERSLRENNEELQKDIDHIVSSSLSEAAHEKIDPKLAVLVESFTGTPLVDVVAQYEKKLHTLHILLEKGEQALKSGIEMVLKKEQRKLRSKKQRPASSPRLGKEKENVVREAVNNV